MVRSEASLSLLFPHISIRSGREDLGTMASLGGKEWEAASHSSSTDTFPDVHSAAPYGTCGEGQWIVSTLTDRWTCLCFCTASGFTEWQIHREHSSVAGLFQVGPISLGNWPFANTGSFAPTLVNNINSPTIHYASHSQCISIFGHMCWENGLKMLGPLRL